MLKVNNGYLSAVMNDTNGNINQEPVFVFAVGYFEEPGFKERFDNDMKRLRGMILSSADRTFVKAAFNQFMGACFSMIKDEDTRIHLHLESYQTLAYYAEVYSSEETFKNIINDIEKPDQKALLFTKSPGRANIVYGDVLLKYYSLINERNDGWYTAEAFDLVVKAKYYIFRAYLQSIEGSNALREEDRGYCLVLLSACFLYLSRWFEPVYYSSLLKLQDADDLNYEYITVRNLDGLKERTCLDYNGQLLVRIIDCCQRLKENPQTHQRIRTTAIEIEEKCLKDLENAKLNLATLRKHKRKIEDSKVRRNAYFKYCITHQLFLNEHALFCTCGTSIGDTLAIKTQHPHTQMDWVKKFEYILDLLASDYALARAGLYESELTEVPKSFNVKESPKAGVVKRRKDAQLKNAFKICYSILDQIAYGIFEVLEIDIEEHLNQKAKAEGKAAPYLYFLSMWDLYPFEEKDFRNIYLVSLLSIAKDLDRTEFAALKSFKKFRNAMEHEALFITDSETTAPVELSYGVSVKRSELIIKTRILMVLTKSAIFSFAYLVRRQSKAKEKRSKNPELT